MTKKCKPCGDSPCNNSWCTYTPKYKVTCGDCGQTCERTWKEACEEGPTCCPTVNYTVEEA